MKMVSKLSLAAFLALTTVAGTACSSNQPSQAADSKKDDQSSRKAFAAALIAEDRLAGMFEAKDGLEGDKAVKYLVSDKTVDEAADFLSLTWNKDVAKKEVEAVLADKSVNDKAAKAFEAKAKADKKEYKAVPYLVADKDKLGANALTPAKFEDVKVSENSGKYVIEYKGLKYTMEKSGETFKVTAKEGKLTK